MLTMELDHPDGYGRVVRDAAGDVAYIVEHRDATDAERAVAEVNAGMYVLAGQRGARDPARGGHRQRLKASSTSPMWWRVCAGAGHG